MRALLLVLVLKLISNSYTFTIKNLSGHPAALLILPTPPTFISSTLILFIARPFFWQGRCFSSGRKKKPVDLIQMRHTELLLMSSGQRLAVILEEQKQKSCLQPPHAYSYCGNEPPRGSSYPSFSLLVFAEATPAMPVRTPEEENKPTAGLVNTETSFSPLEKS